MIIHVLQTVLHLNKKCLSDLQLYRVYNNLFSISQIKSNQIKSFIRPQVNNIHINKNDNTITYIYTTEVPSA